jgi:hypothetical protein
MFFHVLRVSCLLKELKFACKCLGYVTGDVFIHVSDRIRTKEPSDWVGEDILGLKQRGYCDRLDLPYV